MKSSADYRPDIDGLRGIAVLLVLIYHFFPDLLPGGFIGVDVFFVISGYLITGIIFNDIELGKFSIANFYVRRIKRIFPALLAMMMAVLIAGWFFMLDSEFRNLGKHLAGGAAFISNLVLW